MAKHTIPSERWFKSGGINFSEVENIDSEKGIIYGVILCQAGEAKGHGVHLEQSFIDDCTAYANKNHKGKGMKSRFGHPSMSNETLGTELGRFQNFSTDGNQLKADLHLLESANLSPSHKGLKDYMLSMAAEDAEMIMCSIVFKPKYEYQYKGDERVDIHYCDKKGRWHRCRDTNGVATPFNAEAKLYTELDELHFCDIVDQGAATDRLFSEQFNSDKFSVIATQFLNENPQIDQFLKEKPHKLLEFLNERNPQEESTSFGEKLKRFFLGEDKEDINNADQIDMNFSTSLGILGKPNPTSVELSQVQTEIEAFTGTNEKFSAAEVQTKVELAIADKDKALGEKDKEIAQLKADNLILSDQTTPPDVAKKDAPETFGEDDEADEFFSETDLELEKMTGK